MATYGVTIASTTKISLVFYDEQAPVENTIDDINLLIQYYMGSQYLCMYAYTNT